MKQPIEFDPTKTWTIASNGKEERAFNIISGKYGPWRKTYKEAMADIPAGEWHIFDRKMS